MKPEFLCVAALTTFATSLAGAPAGVVFQEQQIDGWNCGTLDVKDKTAVLATLWERLPAEVLVHPTENYYYWQLHTAGREFRGNLRLASGQREKGLLNFGYSEWLEFPAEQGPGEPALTVTGHFGKEDGVVVSCLDGFTADVSYRGKKVRFLLNRIGQELPKNFTPGKDEVFIERTVDESGLAFFLLFNTRQNYFFWLLNEEDRVAEQFAPLAAELLSGRRTGFIFWQQEGRKVLLGVRKLSVDRNDYYDGPFDQLADNYAAETKIRDWIERAYPAHKGHVDTYGYFTDTPVPRRVALNCYLHYETRQQAVDFLTAAKSQPEPLLLISRGGK